MTRHRTPPLLLTLALLSLPATAGTLDVDSAVRRALAENPALRARRQALGIVEGRSRQAGLLPNPELEIERPAEKGVDLELRLGFDATALLLQKGRKEAAAKDLAAAKTGIDSAAVELEFEVREAFHTLQDADRRLALTRDALDAAAAAREMAEALLAAGNTSALPAKTAIAEHESLRLAERDAEVSRTMALERLTRLTGLDAPLVDELAGAGDLPEAPEIPASAARRAVAQSFALSSAQRSLEAATLRARLTRREGRLPDTSVFVVSSRSGGEAGAHGAPATSDSAWTWGGGISVRIPVFDRKQGEVAGREAEAVSLRSEIDAQSRAVASETREAEHHTASAHARARHLRDVVLPARRAVLEETLLHYNAMQIGLFPLVSARRAVIDAELLESAALRDYRIAAARLAALVAGGRPGAGPDTAAITTLSSTASNAANDGGH